MKKKLLVVFVAGGLILGFPAASKAAGAAGTSLSVSLMKAGGGVQKIGGKYYYIDPGTGRRKRGLIRISGKTYYFTSHWYAEKGFHRVKGRLLFTDSRGLVCRPSGLVTQAGIILTRRQERGGLAGLK